MVFAALSPWRYQPHPEVWLLVAAVAGGYWYALTRIGPKVVRPGEPVATRRQVAWFSAGVAIMWLASDWPVHDVGEQALYSVHMLQHMALTYFMPPMLLLGTPTWLMRLIVGDGRVYRAVQFLAKPVVAGVLFNLAVMITHIPGVVNASVTGPPVVHYSLHVMVVVLSLLMWMCVCGPLPELRIGTAGQMVYLFAQSIVPTVPAGWLIFAEGAVYKVYDRPDRLWGISVTTDQQMAGLIMKVGGSIFLWSIVAWLFFARFAKGWADDNTYRRVRRIPDAEITGNDEQTLTYAEVERAFSDHAPADEPTTSA